eukprot:TRINITY_DN48036_c0_g1_i1.p1 TRINITY_DN48036_c0_g1~~TRINITY_DN48036_c0_g1_i1.p1  ORF type:complete len:154 (-),score=18.43 TRINITY_DN48036_c0_g1_i1:105-566(-)
MAMGRTQSLPTGVRSLDQVYTSAADAHACAGSPEAVALPDEFLSSPVSRSRSGSRPSSRPTSSGLRQQAMPSQQLVRRHSLPLGRLEGQGQAYDSRRGSKESVDSRATSQERRRQPSKRNLLMMSARPLMGMWRPTLPGKERRKTVQLTGTGM